MIVMEIENKEDWRGRKDLREVNKNSGNNVVVKMVSEKVVILIWSRKGKEERLWKNMSYGRDTYMVRQNIKPNKSVKGFWWCWSGRFGRLDWERGKFKPRGRLLGLWWSKSLW